MRQPRFMINWTESKPRIARISFCDTAAPPGVVLELVRSWNCGRNAVPMSTALMFTASNVL